MDATVAYDEALNSETATEYPNYQTYLAKWWERRQLWCLAWRNEQHRGNHTNNFAEITVRLYKDVVLCRAKAYNAVSLIDFTVQVMECYYRNRLRDFANGRLSAQRLLLDKLNMKASNLTSCDQITDYEDGRYGVPGSDGTELYVVDSKLGCCSCRDGLTGKFCKHQSAVMRLFKAAFPNAPGITAKARHVIASIALGADCPAVSFYRGLQDDATGERCDGECHVLSDNNSTTTESHNDTVTLHQGDEDRSTDSLESNVMGPLLDEYYQLLSVNCARFSADDECRKALQKAICRLKTVNTASSFATFLHGHGHRRYRSGAAIRVQPTAVSRRRPGVTRGCKRLACGRPPIGSQRPTVKRRHCLTANVAANAPNATSH